MNRMFIAAFAIVFATLIAGCGTLIDDPYGPTYTTSYSCNTCNSYSTNVAYGGSRSCCNTPNYVSTNCGTCGTCRGGCETNWNTYTMDCGTGCGYESYQNTTCGCN